MLTLKRRKAARGSVFVHERSREWKCRQALGCRQYKTKRTSAIRAFDFGLDLIAAALTRTYKGLQRGTIGRPLAGISNSIVEVQRGCNSGCIEPPPCPYISLRVMYWLIFCRSEPTEAQAAETTSQTPLSRLISLLNSESSKFPCFFSGRRHAEAALSCASYNVFDFLFFVFGVIARVTGVHPLSLRCDHGCDVFRRCYTAMVEMVGMPP